MPAGTQVKPLPICGGGPLPCAQDAAVRGAAPAPGAGQHQPTCAYPTSPSCDDRRDEGANGHDTASDEDSSELDLRRSMSMSSGGFSELSADREDVSGLPEPDEADVTELSLRLLLWRAEGADREGARWYLIRSSVVDLYKAWCDQHEADCVACAQETMSGGFTRRGPGCRSSGRWMTVTRP